MCIQSRAFAIDQHRSIEFARSGRRAGQAAAIVECIGRRGSCAEEDGERRELEESQR
jgi:hypothetical protein